MQQRKMIRPGDLVVIALRQDDHRSSSHDQSLSDTCGSSGSKEDDAAVVAYLCTASSSFAEQDDLDIISSDHDKRKQAIKFDSSTTLIPLSDDSSGALRSEVGFGGWTRVYDVVGDSQHDTDLHDMQEVAGSGGTCKCVHVLSFDDRTTKPQRVERQNSTIICGGVYVASKETARIRPLLSLTLRVVRDASDTTNQPTPSPLMTACAKRLMTGRVLFRGSTTILSLPKLGVNRGESVLQMRLNAEAAQPDKRSFGFGEDSGPYILVPSTRITILDASASSSATTETRNTTTQSDSGSNKSRPVDTTTKPYLPAAAKALIEVIRAVRIFATTMDEDSNIASARFVTRTMLFSGPPGVGK